MTKNCRDQLCVDDFRGRVKRLYDDGLLHGKAENYGFYVTTSKADTARVVELLSGPNRDDIHVYYNDVLG